MSVDAMLITSHAFVSDVLSNLSWLFQTIVSQINNHEIASAILFLVLVLWSIARGNAGELLAAIREIIDAALKPNIIALSLLLFLYSYAIFFVAHYLGLWTSNILLDTILEVCFVGFASISIAVSAHTLTSMFKQIILPEIGVGALVGAYIGLESLPLAVNIVLQFLIFGCIYIKGTARLQSTPENVIRRANLLFIVIGVFAISFVTIRLFVDWGELDWKTKFETWIMGVYYPILLVPFAILLGYYASYESLRKRIKPFIEDSSFPKKFRLYILLFPRLVDIQHFGIKEIPDYTPAQSWKEELAFIRSYKMIIRNKTEEANKQISQIKNGQVRAGFDANGIWLDWENLDTIKTRLLVIAKFQNDEWRKHHEYSSTIQHDIVDKLTLHDCTSGSYVSSDGGSYICWMSNGTGFTFGVGSSHGVFPAMEYEGAAPPSINKGNILRDFVDFDDSSSLKHWNRNFVIDDSYC